MPPPAANDRHSIGPRRLRLISWLCDLDLWPFDLETGVRVASKVGNLQSELNFWACLAFGFSSYSLCTRRKDGRTDRRTKANLTVPFLRAEAQQCSNIGAGMLAVPRTAHFSFEANFLRNKQFYLTYFNSSRPFENNNKPGEEIRSVELGVCPMQLFHFWSRDVHPVQNLLLCTKCHENRMIFIPRQHIDARYWYSKSVCLSVRPSVRLSVTFWYQMKTA